MVQRCTNPRNPNWSNYGGRGIHLAAEWAQFAAFYADMGDPPPDTTIERINVNGNYEATNCRWASRREQARNTRANRLLTLNGITQPLVEWADATGIPYWTLHARLRRGWDAMRTLTTAVEGR